MILRQKTVEWEAENSKNKTKSNLFFLPLNSAKIEERSPRYKGKGQTRRKACKGFKTQWGNKWRGGGNSAATKKNTELSGSLQKRLFSD